MVPPCLADRTIHRKLKGSITLKVETKVAREDWVTHREETVSFMIDNSEELKHPAYVSVSPSLTQSIGPFESLKISTSVMLPCHVTLESVNETLEEAGTIAGDALMRQMQIWRGDGESTPQQA